MFVRMLAVHCDQSNGYEISMNGPEWLSSQKTQRNKKRNFRLPALVNLPQS